MAKGSDRKMRKMGMALQEKKLHLGCGENIFSGYINLDLRKLPGVDIVHDINQPLPFPDNTFAEIVALNVLEHVKDLQSVIREMYRVTEPGGIWKIEVPYYNSPYAWNDATHYRAFGLDTFQALARENVTLLGDIKLHHIKTKGIPTFVGKIIPNIPLYYHRRNKHWFTVRELASLFIGNILRGVYIELRIEKG